MARVLRFHEHGSILDKLKLETIPESDPVGDEVLITGGVASGQLRPIIDRVFGLDDYLAAYQHMLSNTQKGKIVVRCN
jgi:NADPH:quinone reductase-like Zn-dependent oxidoreductase